MKGGTYKDYHPIEPVTPFGIMYLKSYMKGGDTMAKDGPERLKPGLHEVPSKPISGMGTLGVPSEGLEEKIQVNWDSQKVSDFQFEPDAWSDRAKKVTMRCVHCLFYMNMRCRFNAPVAQHGFAAVYPSDPACGQFKPTKRGMGGY
jgi:hypothetical protein